MRQRTDAYQAMLDKAKNSPAEQQRQAIAKEKQFGVAGTQAATDNRNQYEANKAAGTTLGQQAANKPIWSPTTQPDYSKPSTPVPNLFKPGESASNSAGFNGSNWGDKSGVHLGDGKGGFTEATHQQATANNPLHVVNAQNNAGIQGAIASGDWTNYNNSQAGQQPGWYDKGEDGNFSQNKQYYGNLLESTMRAINEAKAKGDTDGVAHWEKSLQTRLADLAKAPGMMPSITGMNNTADLAAQYGITQADPNWHNSQYNNPQVSQDGRFNQNHWTANDVFQKDPGLLQDTLNFSGSVGTPEEQKQRQEINNAPFFNQQGAGPNQQPTQDAPFGTDSSGQGLPPQPGQSQGSSFEDALASLLEQFGKNQAPGNVNINNNIGSPQSPSGDEDPNVAGVKSNDIEQQQFKDTLERYFANLWGAQ